MAKGSEVKFKVTGLRGFNEGIREERKNPVSSSASSSSIRVEGGGRFVTGMFADVGEGREGSFKGAPLTVDVMDWVVDEWDDETDVVG